MRCSGSGAHIRCMGKGRKERCTPFRRDTAKLLAVWIGDRCDGSGPLFPSIRGERLSRDALEHLVRKHCFTASRACPSIGAKRVTPHTLRHSTAMDLLHHGVDQAVIALWLGHEFVATTQVYIHADMRTKEKALARVAAPPTPRAASGPTTNSSRSSKGSDYAEHPHGRRPANQPPAETMRHNPVAALCVYADIGITATPGAAVNGLSAISRGFFGIEEVRQGRAGRRNEQRLCLRLARHRADRAPRRLHRLLAGLMPTSP